MKPLRFHTRELAQAALADFFDHVRAAVREGNMDIEESAADYRIVEADD
ncbi:MAG: hypothetical protein JO353_01300 [Phycisphaerae bacterium]|nr:hypothetical protein [Phycisphaerae bacterium]